MEWSIPVVYGSQFSTFSSKSIPDDHCAKRICRYLRRCGALYDQIFCTHVVYFVTIKMGPNLIVVVAKGPVYKGSSLALLTALGCVKPRDMARNWCQCKIAMGGISWPTPRVSYLGD